MKVSEFCSDDCVFIPEDDAIFHETCKHVQDIVMPTPYSAILMIGEPRVVTVVGINGNDFYIEEMMTNGQTSRSVVSRDRVKRS